MLRTNSKYIKKVFAAAGYILSFLYEGIVVSQYDICLSRAYLLRTCSYTARVCSAMRFQEYLAACSVPATMSL